MKRNGFAAHAAIFTAAILLATSVQAATETVSLTGSLAGFSYTPTPNGEIGVIALSGLSPTVVSPGDTLFIDLSLDGLLVIPAGSEFSYLGINFMGTGFDGSSVAVTEDFSLYVLGVETATFMGTTGTSGILSTDAVFFNHTIAFDSLTDTAAVTVLDTPVALTSARLDLGSFNAVPEPSAWLLLIAGIGGVGGMARRARATFRRRLDGLTDSPTMTIG